MRLRQYRVVSTARYHPIAAQSSSTLPHDKQYTIPMTNSAPHHESVPCRQHSTAPTRWQAATVEAQGLVYVCLLMCGLHPEQRPRPQAQPDLVPRP